MYVCMKELTRGSQGFFVNKSFAVDTGSGSGSIMYVCMYVWGSQVYFVNKSFTDDMRATERVALVNRAETVATHRRKGQVHHRCFMSA